jgi:hypothetical protein
MRFVVVALLCAVAASADEAPPAKCELRAIQATKEGSGIDPRITLLRPYLEKEPFIAWHHFKLLDDKQVMITPHGDAALDLSNGRKGTLTYLDHTLASDGDHRLRLKLVVEQGGKRLIDTIFVLDEGGVVMQATHQKSQKQLLIIGISCKTEK